MRRAVWIATVAVVAWGIALISEAQMSPVRLRVTKNSHKERKTTQQDRYGQERVQAVNETVTYTIEVVNLSSKEIKDVRIHWAVLVNPSSGSSSSGSMRVTEGEKTSDLKNGQKYSFDTDKIDLAGTQRDSASYYGTTRTRTGAGIEGYAVEVYADGRVVASEILPIDTKKRIDQIDARKVNQ